MKRRLLIGTSAAVVAALTLLLGGVFATDPAAKPPARPAPAVLAERAFAGFSPGNTEAEILRLRDEARASDTAQAYALLGLAYQQRARETADTRDYARSERALRAALDRDRANVYALGGLGSLALSRHRFRDALALGRRAQRLSPTTARTYGVTGDALVELGRYDEAFAAYDRMAALKPGLSAYARVSHARELRGDRRGAVRAMELAVDAAGSQPEPLAWTRVQLGKLHVSRGRPGAAAREYRAALAAFPGYAQALDALARVEAARGRVGRAIQLERDAVERSPLPDFVGYLGDLYRAQGRPRLAREQYGLVGAIEQLLVANGVRTDLETALFDVDHGLRLEAALVRARRAHRERPSVQADDVLSWALARTGRCGEALRFSKRALRLGTLDAPTYFHRGMIERCLGRHAEARRWFGRALALNPHFSLRWSPVARRFAR
ncbi:MAG TPA: tetratricopeptide repeat protein [Gaiellaceae bacterium]|nr:tetratricopeptide repeat protein [Gaiellaceae bacterium]